MLSLLLLAAAPVSVTAVSDSYPSLAPDGRTLVFQSNRTGRQALWFADADGSDPRIFFEPGQGDPGGAVWSRDGRFVIFASARDGRPSAGQIFRVPAAGGAIERLTPDDGWSRAQPGVAADGSIYVFELKEDERTRVGHIARIPAETAR